MRLISAFLDNKTTNAAAAVLHNGKYFTLAGLGFPSRMEDFIALGAAELNRLREKLQAGVALTNGFDLKDVLLAPPVQPRQIICVGKNYKLHVAGGGDANMPVEPIIFPKSPGCVVASGANIVIPSIVQYPDYEAELVVVIGEQGKNIPQGEAMKHVFGYSCGHDVSARDHQLGLDLTKVPPNKQWMRGKCFDTFAPVGPAIVTADEIQDPHAVRIQCLRDGKIAQDTHRDIEQVERMHFEIPQLINWISQGHTLFPGDLIFCGTPSGTAMELNPKPWMKNGENYTVRIEGIGELINTVRFDS